ncbi:hypothetical protein J6590_009598 [Homalodisca vitripennis]|nr:hypothetical protein J6590_009598 [Homalodisca vitripennis]
MIKLLLILMLTTFGYAFANDSFLAHPKYLTHEEVDELFKSLEKSYSNLTKVHSIGKSVLGKDLLVLEVSSNVHERRPLKPMFKYVGNMHGDEAIGRELIIFLGQYLLNNYNEDSRVKALLDSVDIFLMPSMNPDGFAVSKGEGTTKPTQMTRDISSPVSTFPTSDHVPDLPTSQTSDYVTTLSALSRADPVRRTHWTGIVTLPGVTLFHE